MGSGALMDEMQEAIFRAKCREMYKQFGYEQMLATLAEMLILAEVLGEIIVDERKKERLEP